MWCGARSGLRRPHCADTVEKLRNRAFPEMSGMQTTSEVRKLIAQQISCEGPTLLKWLQTWSLASRNLGRILDPENTGTTTFSTLSAQSGLPMGRSCQLRHGANKPTGSNLTLLGRTCPHEPAKSCATVWMISGFSGAMTLR